MGDGTTDFFEQQACKYHQAAYPCRQCGDLSHYEETHQSSQQRGNKHIIRYIACFLRDHQRFCPQYVRKRTWEYAQKNHDQQLLKRGVAELHRRIRQIPQQK
jgi:hypothetical protein